MFILRRGIWNQFIDLEGKESLVAWAGNWNQDPPKHCRTRLESFYSEHHYLLLVFSDLGLSDFLFRVWKHHLGGKKFSDHSEIETDRETVDLYN